MYKWGSGDTLFEDFLDFLILLGFFTKIKYLQISYTIYTTYS